MSTNKEKKMLTREECEKACTYLLKHCYETDAPALENGDKNKTYTFTPSGFEESEIFKRLIEEHFTPQPFNADELRKAFDESKYGAIHAYDKKNQVVILITELSSDGELFVCFTLGKAGCSCEAFEDNRFYPVAIPSIFTNKKGIE